MALQVVGVTVAVACGALAARTAAPGCPDRVDQRDDLVEPGCWQQGLLHSAALGLVEQGQSREPLLKLRRSHGCLPVDDDRGSTPDQLNRSLLIHR